jgi:hypothetical protein
LQVVEPLLLEDLHLRKSTSELGRLLNPVELLTATAVAVPTAMAVELLTAMGLGLLTAIAVERGYIVGPSSRCMVLPAVGLLTAMAAERGLTVGLDSALHC